MIGCSLFQHFQKSSRVQEDVCGRHTSLFIDCEKPATPVAKPFPPFLPRNILFPFPAGTAWPGLKFFVSGARQLLIFVSSCFPQHKGRPWLPSKQLPATFQHPKAWFSISIFQMPGFFSAQTCLHSEEPEDSY